MSTVNHSRGQPMFLFQYIMLCHTKCNQTQCTPQNPERDPIPTVAGVCVDLLLSYQRNSVGVVEGGNGGDERCSGRF